MLKKIFSYGIIVAFLIAITGPACFAADKPNPAFFNESWTTMDNLKEWRNTCKITMSPVKIIGETTPEQKALLDIFSVAFKKFRKEFTEIYRLTDRLLSSSASKLDSVSPLGGVGEVTNKEILSQIKSAAKNKGKLILSGHDIYFDAGSGWKKFSDADLAGEMWASADKPMSGNYEKASFVFSKWGSNKKTAVFTGRATDASTKGTITHIFGPGLEEGQKQAAVKIEANAQTKIWDKIETITTVVSGVMQFTIKETCAYTAKASKTKITVPAESEALDKEEGKVLLDEFLPKIY